MFNKNEFEIKDETNEEKQENNMALGIAFGALAGSVSVMILSIFAHIGWGILSMGICLFGGMVIGMNIPKKK